MMMVSGGISNVENGVHSTTISNINVREEKEEQEENEKTRRDKAFICFHWILLLAYPIVNSHTQIEVFRNSKTNYINVLKLN